MIIQLSIYIISHMFQIVNKKSVKSDTVGESLEGTTKKFASGVFDIVKNQQRFFTGGLLFGYNLRRLSVLLCVSL